jgi:hypothetical protein
MEYDQSELRFHLKEGRCTGDFLIQKIKEKA